MRRAGIFFLALVAAATMAASEASAQPKVTISGFIDQASSWTRNLSIDDLNASRTGDDELYARTRVRPDIIAEVGTTKFVLGLEIDYVWGQTAGQDTFVCLSAACPNAPQRFGSSAGADQNTDIPGIIEIKWAYTEFRVPLIPWVSTMRLGAQPMADLYKGGIYATGDFVGLHLTSQFSPMLKGNFSYNQLEEESTGPRDGFIRGEEFVITTSVEITPFKGLDIRPVFSWANFDSVANGNARRARGGVGTGAGIYPLGAIEDRFTIGVDTRWRFGAFYIDPTVLYQFGHREQVRGGVLDDLKRDAWYLDLRAGWRAGPLLLEAIGVYTTGNKAEDRIDVHPDVVNSTAATRGRRSSTLEHFEPISTDNTFFAGWSEITSSGIDYSNRFRANAANLNLAHTIGYDKYGLMRLGARASYALTPAFTLRAMASATWTAEEVDTSSTVTAGAGLTPGDANGDARYYGTELNLGFQWRFATNVAFDVVGSYLFTGPALAAHLITGTAGGPTSGRDPQDIQAISARIRFSF